MDPVEIVKMIRWALEDNRIDDAIDAIEEISEWIANGGFMPDGYSLEKLNEDKTDIMVMISMDN